MLYLRQGDVHRAIPVLERAMGLCQDWHIPLFLPRLAAALGLAYALEGRVAAGLALVEHGVEQEVARDDRGIWRPWSPASARRICWRAAWRRRANAPRRRSISPASTSNAATQAWALWLLGESTARQASPEVEPAAGHYRQALALAEELGMRPLQAHCHRGLGTLYATTGQREQARTALSTAIEMYRAMDDDLLAPRDRGGTGAGGGTVMDFTALRTQVIALLQREQRLSYRALKRQFTLDDEDLEALKDELIYAKRLAVDEDGRVLVWTGATSIAPTTASPVPLPAHTGPLSGAGRGRSSRPAHARSRTSPTHGDVL